jgi:hypothetical protein
MVLLILIVVIGASACGMGGSGIDVGEESESTEETVFPAEDDSEDSAYDEEIPGTEQETENEEIDSAPSPDDAGDSDVDTDDTDASSGGDLDLSSFDIKGTWKSVGETGTGQAQPGAIVNFSDHECNLYSPRDTYALHVDGGKLKLDATGLLGGTPSFTVTVVDNDNIVLDSGSSHETTLRRVG